MQSLFGRAAAIFTARREVGEPCSTAFEKMVARQKALKTADVLDRLSGPEPEPETAPLYDSSVYNSLGSPEEPWDQ